MTQLDAKAAIELSERVWSTAIIPTLTDYIKIPALSPDFDKDWAENGHLDAAVEMFAAWAESRPIHEMSVKRHSLSGRTPMISIEIAATEPSSTGTVLLYGHLDKQPDMTGWSDGLGPRTPVLQGDKLYGRGGADDGYAMFASLTAVQILQEQNLPHRRIVILIEASEESGSPDLPAYVTYLRDQIGDVDLVICLDSGCGNYEQIWNTTSLRGIVIGYLTVEVLRQGVHSGSASGIVPDGSQVGYTLIRDRLASEDGLILLSDLRVEIPQERIDEAAATAEVLGRQLVDGHFPWVVAPDRPDERLPDVLLAGTWEPTVTVTGVEGFPPTLSESGNVMRPSAKLKLSIRIPPTMDCQIAAALVKDRLEANPVPGTLVTFELAGHGANGWHAPILSPWLQTSLQSASQAFFGKPAMAMGEGGTIPFMGMLGELFPETQFVITGVLGPASNAHGPDEFLHIPMGQKLTAAVATIIHDHATR